MDRDERPAGDDERVPAGGTNVDPQRHDRHEAEDADRDEGALHDAGGDVAEGEAFVLPFEDRDSTTAVPMLATMTIISRSAPKAILLSAPAPTIQFGWSSTGA